MKKKWLSVLLAILSLLVIVPVIASCSCSDDNTTSSTPSTSGASTPDSTGSSTNDSTGSSTPGSTTDSTVPSTPDSTGGSTVPSTPGSTDDPTDSSTPGSTVIPDSDYFPSGEVAPVVKYLRIANLGTDSVTLKFNALGKNIVYEIRYSSSPINADNFDQATKCDVAVTSSGEVKTFTIEGLSVSKETPAYIAVKAKSGSAESTLETVRAGGVNLIYVDTSRITSVYCGEVIKDLTPLFDELSVIGDPYREDYAVLPSNRVKQFYYKTGDLIEGALDPEKTTHERYGTDLAPIIDLEYNHYVECIYVFYSHQAYDLDVRSSKNFANFNTPSAWDATNKTYLATQLKANAWNKIEIGKEVRFIQLQFLDGQAPVEVAIYGYQTSETEGDEILNTTHKLPTIGEMMGVCGLLGDGGGYCRVDQLKCATVLREYHNLGWSYNWSSFPKKSTTLTNTNLGNFDRKYADHAPYNLIVPCLQWSDGDNPARVYDKITGKLSPEIATFTQKYLPSTYIAYADVVYQYAARYGSSKMGYLYENVRVHSDNGAEIGLNYIKWIECGNEPNGEDQRGTTPYQLAALTSASYDGHMRTVLSDVYNPDDFTYFLGAKNADPDFKVAMAGLAGIGDRYITSMCYWMRANRKDIHNTWTTKNDTIAMDAFNVHTYFGKVYYLNGQQIIVGVSPEEYGLADAMSALIEYRDKYYPNVEVWLTEFGWDTNESYETMTSSHSYGPYNSREVQGMWLTRAYLILSAIGVDKATMYMLEDLGNDKTAIGKYGTCGLYTNEYTDDGKMVYQDSSGNKAVKGKYWTVDKEGKDVEVEGYIYLDTGLPGTSSFEAVEVIKPGYYYMSTLLNTLRDFTFRRELETGDDRIWVYQYSDADKNEAYALWCPTSNVTRVDGYKLYVGTDYESVVLTESDALNASMTGRQTNLKVDADGFVSVNVSENPVYVVVNK